MDKDRARLQDIVQYASFAIKLVATGDPVQDMVDRLALERALFIVGEAAAQLSPGTRASIRQPWSEIMGMRHVLAHRSAAVETRQLVLITRRRLPELVSATAQHL